MVTGNTRCSGNSKFPGLRPRLAGLSTGAGGGFCGPSGRTRIGRVWLQVDGCPEVRLSTQDLMLVLKRKSDSLERVTSQSRRLFLFVFICFVLFGFFVHFAPVSFNKGTGSHARSGPQ